MACVALRSIALVAARKVLLVACRRVAAGFAARGVGTVAQALPWVRPAGAVEGMCGVALTACSALLIHARNTTCILARVGIAAGVALRVRRPVVGGGVATCGRLTKRAHVIVGALVVVAHPAGAAPFQRARQVAARSCRVGCVAARCVAHVQAKVVVVVPNRIEEEALPGKRAVGTKNR